MEVDLISMVTLNCKSLNDIVDRINMIPIMSSIIFKFENSRYWIKHETSDWYVIGLCGSHSRYNIYTKFGLTESLIHDAINIIVIQEVHGC